VVKTGYITVIAAFVSFSSSSWAQPAQCLAPLNPNLKTISWIGSSASNDIDLKSSFCSSTFEATYHHDKQGLSATVLIYDVPVTFGGSSDSEANWQKWAQFCGDSSAHFSPAATQSFYLEYATPDQFKAYVVCIKASADRIPVVLTAQVVGDAVVLKADYTPIGDAPRVATVKNFETIGLTCNSGTFRKGDAIISGGISHTCTRSQAGTAEIVSLNTNEGSRDLPIPRRRADTVAGNVIFLDTHAVTHETPVRDVEYWVDLDGLNHDTRSYNWYLSPSKNDASRPQWHSDDPTAHYLSNTLTFPTGYGGNLAVSPCGCEEHEDTHGGYGCPYVFRCAVSFDSATSVHMSATNGGRRVGVGFKVTVAVNSTTSETTQSAPAELLYGHTFVVPVPSGSSVSLKVHSSHFGDYVLALQGDNVVDPNGLIAPVPGGPQVQGGITYHTLKVIDPNTDEYQALQ
jgi:hypothetical protein